MSGGIGLSERFRAFIRDKLRTTTRNVDMFLSERLPDYITQYDLATIRELEDIDSTFNDLEMRINDLEDWRGTVSERLDSIRKRIDILEKKYIK